VTIGKVQVSSALRATREEMAMLEPFAEPIYLHQVVARGEDETLHRYDDLPRFLAERVPHGEPGPTIEECRVHFHVPIFADHLGPCGTTRFFLEAILPELDTETPLEVETYTWDVLPRELRTTSVAESIVRELRWVEQSI
jgi:hypothetical protein